MPEEDWKDQHYDEVFEGVCLHLEQQREENPQFTREHLEGLLEALYVDEGNDQLGRSEPVKIKNAATIAAYEHFLAEWPADGEGS